MQQQLAIVGLVVLAVAGLMYALIYPYLSGEIKAQKRQQALVRGGSAGERGVGVRGSSDPAKRRKAIQESLKEIEEKNSKKRRVTLEQRLAQAGLSWSKQMFFIISFGIGLLFAVIAFAVNGEPLIAAGMFIAGALGFPNWMLGFLRKRRIAQFVEEFPGALDIIIRGVKAGLPVADCFRVIASEGQEPVRSEFRQIIEAQTIGLTAGEAVERFADRVPVAEASFFSIVINIQQKSGGNLSEALGNLSRVLRDRKKMKAKIKAMSSEAKSSAGIIGSLPFIVGGAVYLTTPSYMMLLFTTTIGHFVIAGGLIWMMIGILIMRKMINFDF